MKEDEKILAAIAWDGSPPDIVRDPPHPNWRKGGLWPDGSSRDDILQGEAKLIAEWQPSEVQRRKMIAGIRGGKSEFFMRAADFDPAAASRRLPQRAGFRSIHRKNGCDERHRFSQERAFDCQYWRLELAAGLTSSRSTKEAERAARVIIHRTRMNLMQVDGKLGIIKRQVSAHSQVSQAAEEGEKLVAYISRSATRALKSNVVEMESDDYEFQTYSLAALVQNCAEGFRKTIEEQGRELRIAPSVENLPYAEWNPTLYR